jgi:hypothetical protein
MSKPIRVKARVTATGIGPATNDLLELLEARIEELRATGGMSNAYDALCEFRDILKRSVGSAD